VSDHIPLQTSEALTALGQIVLGDEPLPQILERVVHLAAGVLPIPVDASITLIVGDEPATPAFTSPTAIALDERQYASQRGPCLDAAAGAQRIVVVDTRAETRWPEYAAAAAERGVLASMSIPLPVQSATLGALNFYAATSNAFDDQAVELAETFGRHAAVAVANAHRYEQRSKLAEQMKQAMASRATIEQAKGIIMRDRGCTAEVAFDVLVELSQQAHLKLRELAQRIVDQVSGG
jgi:GAF domain-containing protein